jgi:hypothetical protein
MVSLRRTLALASFTIALGLPSLSYADAAQPVETETPAETPASEAPATGAEKSEEPREKVNFRGGRVALREVTLPIHAAERARARVAFAHERRDLHRAAAAKPAKNADKSPNDHAAKDADHPPKERAESAKVRLEVAAERRGVAAALRESARDRRINSGDRRDAIREKRSLGTEFRGLSEEMKAAAAERRAAAEERKAARDHGRDE